MIVVYPDKGWWFYVLPGTTKLYRIHAAKKQL